MLSIKEKLATILSQYHRVEEQSPLLGFIVKQSGLLVLLAILGLLLLRNPFSDRTLIPNFEPFPDSFHYVVPPRCFLDGEGWKLCREGVEGVSPAVPPLYGLILLPSFLINSDPRMFYFTNVVLAFASLLLLHVITQKITRNRIATFLVCFIFVTTYQVYWLPTLAMAENLLLLLFLASIYFIAQKKLSPLQLILAGTVIVGQFATKYASLPTVVALGLVLAIKTAVEARSTAEITKKLSLLALPPAIVFIAIGAVDRIVDILGSSRIDASTALTEEQPQDVWFSLSYVSRNFEMYAQSFFGRQSRFLWDYTPLVSNWVAALGWFGLGYGFTKRRLIWISSGVFLSVALQVLILSGFYSHDTRYILILLPTLLIGLALAVRFLLSYTQTFSLLKTWHINLGLLVVIGLVAVSSFTRIKSQVGLNLKYAETPWWFIASKQIDSYFTNLEHSRDQKPVFITPMSPYLLDFYTDTSLFEILPLNPTQDFRKTKVEVWGENDYSDLINLYQHKLDHGHPVFVGTYGLGNETHLKESFSDVEQSFNLTEVDSGCFELCKIYRVETATPSAQLLTL